MTDFEPQYHDWDKYARDALDRPSDSAWWDDRCYTSHGCVFSWADRSDDLIGESNYHVMVEELTACERDEDDPDVFTGTSRHWAVGGLTQIWVRVYSDDGELTPAFRRAVELTEEMMDYPILDDVDFCERESAEQDRQVQDARWSLEHERNGGEECDDIWSRFLSDMDWCEAFEGADLRWDYAEEVYALAREAYYLDRGEEIMVDYRREVINREIPGQQWLA